MQLSLSLLSLLVTQAVSSNVFAKRACVADNCSRGVAGTNGNPPRTSRIADCSKFFATTVTPAATTVTVTVTTTLAPAKRDVEARQVTVIPTAIPAYATYCKGVSAYKSACSCAGVTPTTIFATTPTVTVMATATFTPAPLCSAGKTSCPASGCVDLTSDNSNCGTCGNACASGLVCGQSQCVLPSIYACTGAPTNDPCGEPSCGGYCFADINGRGFCKQPLNCLGLQACTTGADCPSTVCLVNGCGHVCAGTQYLCPNNSVPKMLFAKAVKAAHVEGRKVVMTEIGPKDE